MASGSDDNGGKKKKMTIIGVSAIVLVAMVVAVTVGVTRGSSNATTGGGAPAGAEITTTSKAIESICQPTDYRETCEKALNTAAANISDPKELVKVAFQVAVKEIKIAINNSDTLRELVKDPKSSQSVQNCRELLEYSIDDLERSFERLGKFDLSKVDELMEELNVWLSGSITFQTTCLDQFENRTDNAGEKMKEILKTSRELTINGLNMVTEISSILTSFSLPTVNRRLLSEHSGEEFPAWVTSDQHRLLKENANTVKPDLIIAKDGSGKYKTINEGLKDIPLNSEKVFVVYVKQGVYDEIVTISRNMINVMFIGDGPQKTKVTGSLSRVDVGDIWRTATFSAVGDRFVAKDMGFENSAGAMKHQAVALRVQSQRSIFHNCQIDGYQDTLYAHVHQQFYRDCTISGTIDIIFGNSNAIFQNCKIIIRQPLVEDEQRQCVVLANYRELMNQTTALVLQNCTISASPEYLAAQEAHGLETYLARPPKPYSRAIVLQSNLDKLINPVGWLTWMGTANTDTCYFAEFGNRGAGAATKGRADWPGVKKVTQNDVKTFTVRNYLHGDLWIKSSGVPFYAGFVSGL